jgi:hypothetical protein
MEMSASRIFETEFAKPLKSSFWSRQFAQETTPNQIAFDLIFGAIGPVLCFVFDPIVFRGSLSGRPLFADGQVFVYFLSGMEITTLCLWLLCGAAFPTWNNFVGAVLLIGGFFGISVGLLLFPFSVVGLMIGVGLFGFTPFMTAFVYLRNGFRAWNSESEETPGAVRVSALFLSLLLMISVPALASAGVRAFAKHTVDEVIMGDPQHAIAASRGLGPLKYLVVGSQLDRIVQAYAVETSPSRKETLKSCYREITGEDIDVRLGVVQD